MRQRAAERRWLGGVAVLGSLLGLGLAPLLVTAKYMTGWAIIPEPFWVAAAEAELAAAFPGATPVELWTGFGTVYALALLFILSGLLATGPQLRSGPRAQRVGFWLIAAGLALVLPGDLIHSWTWHQDDLTVPTPGSNPVANTAYAVHMMGMNLVMVGSVLLGVTALRRRTLSRWLAWMFALTLPAAVLASVTLLPTTPSGGLWLFSVAIGSCGWFLARGQASRLVTA